MHNNYTKIKGLDSGKITSLPKSQKYDQLFASLQSLAKINHMLITSLICKQRKWSRFLFHDQKAKL